MVRRIPHCSHWGAYTLLVEGQEIIGVEPFEHDPAPSPIIHSVKDWLAPERRVLRPMVREGWLRDRHRSDPNGRGREKFIPVDWDDVTTMVAEEIQRVSRDHGNEAIFGGSYGWSSCGRFHHASTLLRRMLNLSGGYTGHVDTYSIAAGPVILRHVLGSDEACKGHANTLDTIATHTETLVIFGAMSPRTAQSEAGGIGVHSLEGYLRQIAERGTKVVLVSPLREDLPDWMPAEWWPIRPNTDTALMLGLAGEIVLAGLEDTGFLDRCTSGSDRLLAYLRGDADGQPKHAEWAARITGLKADQIRALSRQLVQTRSMITASWSLQRAHHGEQPFWAAIGLAAVAGQIGLPGGGMGFGYGSLGGVGAPINLGKSPAISQGRKPIDSFIPVARISDMLLYPGAEYSYEGHVRRYPDTRLVYWAGGNPFHHHQDLNRLSQAWLRPETIIVQDPNFTATARRADIVLPVSTSLERNDIAATNRSTYVFAMAKAVDSLGESRSEFAIFEAICEKLGTAEAFNEGLDEMGWLQRLYEESRDHAMKAFGFAMPDFKTFWDIGYAACPVKQDHTYLADFRRDPDGHALKTESGRIVLGSALLEGLGYEDCLHHPAWMEPVEWLGAASPDELHLISHQPKGRLHSQLETAPSSMADKAGGREQVVINPADAARFGVAHGATVRLWNDRGACLATARLSEAVAPGVAVLPTGGWFTPHGNTGLELSGNPNVLTVDIGTSSFGQGCSAHTCLVRLQPIKGEMPDPQETYRAELAAVLSP